MHNKSVRKPCRFHSIVNRSLLLPAALLLLAAPCHAQTDSLVWKGDTLFVNTSSVGAMHHGYNGTTPVEIAIHKGRVAYIRPLPNRETKRYFNRLRSASLFNQWDGLNIDKAIGKEVDVVSGATYSSQAVIGNVRAGLSVAREALGKEKKNVSPIIPIVTATAACLCAGCMLLFKKRRKRT